ncbi:MAG: site-specific DNA-methyltransferase [Caldilineales bacterium]|nr:site-specific DNA-methyltransferase [Caldilineales bacterium]
MDGMNSLFGHEVILEEEYRADANLVLFHGDVLDFLATIPDEIIQLVVTSPPYNIGKEYETRVSIDEYLEQQGNVIAELHRVLSPNGSICWQVGNYVENGEIFPLVIYYYPIFKDLGMKLRNRIVWHFGHGLHAKNRFSGRYETLLWFSKGDEYIFNLDPVRIPSKYPGKRHYKGPNKGSLSGNPKGKNPSDIWFLMEKEWETGLWDIPNVKSNHPEKTVHPAQFPIELVERCVLSMSEEGDWVLDPYSGVGSTLIAALKQGRKGMGCEKEAEYVEIAEDRLRKFFAGSLSIRPMGKPVHQPTGREKIAQFPEAWTTPHLLENKPTWANPSQDGDQE